MKILGLDLSVASTGLAIMDTEGLVPVWGKTIKTKARDGPDFRLASICDEIEGVLLSDKNLRTAAIESAFIHPKNKKGRDIILGLHGAVTVLLFNYHVKSFKVTPRELKKFITGEGGADKEMMMKALGTVYHIECENDDVADAVALCLWLKETMMEEAG